MIDIGDVPYGVEYFLESSSDTFVPHVVLRGTYLPGTVRCTSGDRFRPPSYVGPDAFRFIRDAPILKCYADVRVNAYVLGSGPSVLTVQVADEFPPSRTEADLEKRRLLWENTLLIEGGEVANFEVSPVEGREAILFIGPAVDVSVEAWEVFWTWNVERRDDGTVIAVHSHRGFYSLEEYQMHRSKLEMELPVFAQAVTTAHQARVAANGGRTRPAPSYPMLVTDANRLREFFSDPKVGAYDHPDGPPAQPPPPCGLAVPNQADNPGLMRDCIALLELKDTLRGTAALNWMASSTITTWEGITLNASSTRVTAVELDDEGLGGTIPASLGRLSALETLDLSDNSLTGEIPAELGLLGNLEVLRLSGNSLSGCIPPALKDVPTNDLASLGLPYCDDLPPAFSTSTYAFSVDAGAATGTPVGKVSATSTGGAIAYSISAGDAGGEFAIATTTGRISVAGPLFLEPAPLRALTVRASDGRGGVATTTVRIAVTSVCRNGAVVPKPDANPALVGDCLVLYHGVMRTLAGSASLGWSADAALTDWRGVRVEDGRVRQLLLAEAGLDGSIPPELGRLEGVYRIDLDTNRLTGAIPSQLGDLSNLERLFLFDNDLTGPIPSELGRLKKLKRLDLDTNDLSGQIPSDLGGLSDLTHLYLHDNKVTGEIPAALADLSALETLYLSGNSLTGEDTGTAGRTERVEGVGSQGQRVDGWSAVVAGRSGRPRGAVAVRQHAHRPHTPGARGSEPGAAVPVGQRAHRLRARRPSRRDQRRPGRPGAGRVREPGAGVRHVQLRLQRPGERRDEHAGRDGLGDRPGRWGRGVVLHYGRERRRQVRHRRGHGRAHGGRRAGPRYRRVPHADSPGRRRQRRRRDGHGRGERHDYSVESIVRAVARPEPARQGHHRRDTRGAGPAHRAGGWVVSDIVTVSYTCYSPVTHVLFPQSLLCCPLRAPTGAEQALLRLYDRSTVTKLSRAEGGCVRG